MILASLFERLEAELKAGETEAAEATAAALDAAGNAANAALGKLVIAQRRHDSAALLRIAAGSDGVLLRRDPQRHLLLARSLRFTLGVPAAAQEFESLCSCPDNAHGLAIEDACAMARLARLGTPPQSLQFDGAAEIPIKLQQGLTTIKASVNELPPAIFILDTGAPSSILNRAYCRRVGLPCPEDGGRTARDAAGNPMELVPMRVDRLGFDGLVIRNWLVEAAMLSPNFQVAGVLSVFDTFQGSSFELDFAAMRLRAGASVEPPERGSWSALRHTWDGGKCFLWALINGAAEGWFLLDSGAAGNLVTPALATLLYPGREETETISSPVAAGRMAVQTGFTAKLKVEGAQESEEKFSIAELRADPDELLPLETHGVLGMPWMQGQRLFFPASRQQVLLMSSL